MFTKKRNKQKNVSQSRSSRLDGQYSNNKTISSYRFNHNLKSKDDSTKGKRSTEANREQHDKVTLSKRKIGVLFLISIFIFGLFWQLTLSRSVHVNFIETNTSPFRSTEEYQSKISEILSRDLSSSTKFTINSASLESEIEKVFPEVDGVVIRLPVVGRTPYVTLAIRQPVLRVVTKTNATVLVDGNGLVIGNINSIQSKTIKDLPTVIDQSGLEITQGRQILTTETVKFILESKAQFEAKSINISKLVLPSRVNGLDIYLEGRAYFIKMDSSGDARLQAGTYLALISHLDSKGLHPKEYIDARVEERAFYR
jgi:hypothetical protein